MMLVSEGAPADGACVGSAPHAARSEQIGFAGLAAMLVLLPFGRSAELGVLLCWLALILQLASSPIALWQKLRAHLNLLGVQTFLLVWIATLVSCIDAEFSQTAWSGSLGILRFLAPVIVASYLSIVQFRRLQQLVVIVLAIWIIDALIQASLGIGLRGMSGYDRLSGIFGADNLKLGLALAALSPLLLLAHFCLPRSALLEAPTLFSLSNAQRIGAQIGAWVLIAVVLLLAGQRAAWISFAAITALWIWQLPQNMSAIRKVLILGGGATFGVIAIGFTLNQLDQKFAARLQRTQGLLSFDQQQVDFALAGRLPIWQTSIAMSSAHPINGVGLRSFRQAYPSYAKPGDPWLQTGDKGVLGANHPHQLVFELLCEIGWLGLLICFAAAARIAWAYRKISRPRHSQVYAWCLLGMLFPFNTHPAFFSSFWALVLWWLAALLCAGIKLDQEHAS